MFYIKFCANDIVNYSCVYSKVGGDYTRPFFYILQLKYNYKFCCLNLETGVTIKSDIFDRCNRIKTKSNKGSYQIEFNYSSYEY